jgi:hypothetical protein
MSDVTGKLMVKDAGGRDVKGYNNGLGIVEITEEVLADIEAKYEFDEGGVFKNRKTGKSPKPKAGAYVNIQTSTGKLLAAHRAVFAKYGSEKLKPGYVIDHVNGNKQDNSMSNLRQISHRENGENRSGIQKNAKKYVVLQGAHLNTDKRGYPTKPFCASKVVCGHKVNLAFDNELDQLRMQYALNASMDHLWVHARWKEGMTASQIIAAYTKPLNKVLPTDEQIKQNLIQFLLDNPQTLENRIMYQQEIGGFIDLTS